MRKPRAKIIERASPPFSPYPSLSWCHWMIKRVSGYSNELNFYFRFWFPDPFSFSNRPEHSNWPFRSPRYCHDISSHKNFFGPRDLDFFKLCLCVYYAPFRWTGPHTRWAGTPSLEKCRRTNWPGPWDVQSKYSKRNRVNGD